MRYRASIVLLSAIGDLVIIGAIVVGSGLAPGALPLPHQLLAAPVERVIQLADIPLPAAAHQAPPRSPMSSPRPDVPSLTPPPELPASTGEPPVGRGPGIDGGVGDIAARVEHGNGPLTGDGLPTAAVPEAPVSDRPVHLHAGIEAPRKLRDVQPQYPAAARATRTQGVVILEVTINAQGQVVDARVLRPLPGLDRAALDAVTQWTFAPARLNGEAIPVVMTVTVNFQLQ